MTELMELIEHICRRPHLFCPNGTFYEVVSYLDGYDWALHQFAPEGVKAVSLYEFGRWLSYINENEDLIWMHNGREVECSWPWWSKVRCVYPDDAEAFEALPRLYRQFLEDPHRIENPGLW